MLTGDTEDKATRKYAAYKKKKSVLSILITGEPHFPCRGCDALQDFTVCLLSILALLCISRWKFLCAVQLSGHQYCSVGDGSVRMYHQRRFLQRWRTSQLGILYSDCHCVCGRHHWTAYGIKWRHASSVASTNSYFPCLFYRNRWVTPEMCSAERTP